MIIFIQSKPVESTVGFDFWRLILCEIFNLLLVASFRIIYPPLPPPLLLRSEAYTTQSYFTSTNSPLLMRHSAISGE